VDDATVTQGNEVAEYDANTKTLTFRIDEGNTTAQDIFNIFKSSDPNYDPVVAGLFKASLVGTGAGLITTERPSAVPSPWWTTTGTWRSVRWART